MAGAQQTDGLAPQEVEAAPGQRGPTWLQRIEALRPGDPCDVRYGGEWVPAIVRINGGPYYWQVTLVNSQNEQVSHSPAPDNDRPDVIEAERASTTFTRRNGFPQIRQENMSPYIEQVRCRGQVDAWPRIGTP